MKSRAALAAGVFLVWGIGHGVEAAEPSLDREGGFRDAKLGAPFASFRGLNKVRTHKGIDYYARQGDSLTYAGLKLSAILYGFSGGVLQRVQLRTVKAPEPSACDANRVRVLDTAIAAYSDATLTHESDPISPSDPLANQCAAEAGSIEGCAVFVYSAKKVQVQLNVVEEEYKKETSRHVLTSEQLSALLRKEAAKPLGGRKEPTTGQESAEEKAIIAEIEALGGAAANLARQRMRELGAPEEATFYEGKAGITIGAAKLPDGRFDVITLRDVSICYHMVDFSAAPPPRSWVRDILEKQEKQKK